MVARQLIAFGRVKRDVTQQVKPAALRRKTTNRLRAIETNLPYPFRGHFWGSRKTTNRLRAIETAETDAVGASHFDLVARQLIAFGRLKRRRGIPLRRPRCGVARQLIAFGRLKPACCR